MESERAEPWLKMEMVMIVLVMWFGLSWSEW